METVLGRAVAGLSWQEVLEDYDLRRGRVWVLVPLWTTAAVAVVRRLSVRGR